MAKKLLEVAQAMNAAPDPAEIVSRDRRIRSLEQSEVQLKAAYRHAIDQIESLREQSDFLARIGEARDPEAWEREIKRGTSKASAIIEASDWHLGEVVDPGTVNGLNRFDQAEGAKRVRKFFTKIPEYVDRYVPMAKDVWLWAGGDFISGYIHPELVENNSMSPTEECRWFRELWNDGVATLLKAMPGRTIYIPTSFGNHGRTTDKSRVSTAATNSFEQLTYWVLADDWKKEPRVKWRISDGYHNVQNIQGRLVRFHHGDGLKYQGGVGGITIPVRKAIAQWNKSQRVDLDCFGHWHEYMDGGHFVSNGSLVGYGAYSLRVKAEWQPPIQSFLVFDRKFGLRQSTRLFCTDV